MFGLLITFILFYMAYSFISLATNKRYYKRYHNKPIASESKSQEVWDDGEVPWYLFDEDNKNNSDNSSALASSSPNKPLPIIPMALIIME